MSNKRGCLFYLGVTMAIIVLLIAIGLGAIFFKVKGVADEYTSTTPLQMPPLTISAQQTQNATARLEQFLAAVDQQAAARLILSEDELNAIVASHPGLDELRNFMQIRFSFENDHIGGMVSIPLKNKLPLGIFEDRYFNGSGAFKVAIHNGNFIWTIADLEVSGKKIPEEIMAEVRKQNLANEVQNDPQFQEILKRLSRFYVQERHLVIETGQVDGPLMIPPLNDSLLEESAGAATPQDISAARETQQQTLATRVGRNLLINGAAEDGIQGWTVSHNSFATRQANPAPKEGNFYFFAGEQKGKTEAWQEIDLGGLALLIDEGMVGCLIKGYMRDLEGQDITRIEVDFLAPDNTIITTAKSPDLTHKDHWVRFQTGRPIPAGTSKIKFKMVSLAMGGEEYNNAFFDDLYFGIVKE